MESNEPSIIEESIPNVNELLQSIKEALEQKFSIAELIVIRDALELYIKALEYGIYTFPTSEQFHYKRGVEALKERVEKLIHKVNKPIIKEKT